ncbi:MAG: flagellar basal body-associated FliL family protein [Desulfamplus sp.]|nr:flagellar basal body-associated FliL family protein [Desulfamplus sp.]MBF0412307.1 flagellar basal body-associated FliL family protein [Desulfamplus sp.]
MFKFKKKDKSTAKDETISDKSKKDNQSDVEPVKKSFFKRIFSLKFMVIFFILIVIIAGALFAGWFFFLKPNNTDTGESAKIEESAKTAEVAGAVDKDGKPISLPPPEPDFPDIVYLEVFKKIKLQESEGLNYLTLKISVELIKPEMRKDIESNSEKIRQTVESEIKKMTWLLLRTPEGKINFKYRLIQELNKALPSRMVKNIYFTNFWLQ